MSIRKEAVPSMRSSVVPISASSSHHYRDVISPMKMSYRSQSKIGYSPRRTIPSLSMAIRRSPVRLAKYACQWKVQSHSDPSKLYTVSLLQDPTARDRWQCSCPQWKFRRKICKHILEVQQQSGIHGEQTATIIGRTHDGRAIFKGQEGAYIVDADGDKQSVLMK